jgi:hypothetical protein
MGAKLCVFSDVDTWFDGRSMMVSLYFTDFFEVDEAALDDYGAFNVSLVTDLPLFIDPFLLFNSEDQTYQNLHDDIINYLRFLKRKSEGQGISEALLLSWYCFSEVRQNWLGFCKTGNSGRGLGRDFARSLNRNLVLVFNNFGQEKVTKGSHLEKLCLIKGGVGRDMISDFTTNLIKGFLLQYTEAFATKNIDPALLRKVAVERAVFRYDTETWMSGRYVLPFYQGDYVLLTPKDILTKDETWISHSDMVSNFYDIPDAIENSSLRAQVSNYFESRLPKDKDATKEEHLKAVEATISKFPELLDFYIRQKEDSGDQAVATSNAKVMESQRLYIKQFAELIAMLQRLTPFYSISGNTADETRRKIEYFKDVVENKGGHHIFYVDGKPVRKETDIHILFRLTWHGTPSDVSREVNDGRGPADFKVSRGAGDKTLVEFKLASNTQLRRNLEKQLEIYKKASDASAGFKVIVYFTEEELVRVKRVLRELKMERDSYIYLVDARLDNKPSASKA